MKMNKEGLQLIKDSESFQSKPYVDPATGAEPITIGYGTTVYPSGVKVTLKDMLVSEHEAEFFLMADVSKFEKVVLKYVTSAINENQFSALVSFAYNLGLGALKGSNLLKKVNENPNDKSIFDEFLRWNKGGGKVLKGLVIRRNKEAQLYFKK
jgi:lysozyme